MRSSSLLSDGSRVDLVVNAASRRGRAALDLVRARFAARGPSGLGVHPVASGAELAATIDRVMTGDPDLLVVGGGDGSIGCAASRVTGTRTVLGVLPLGTANDFARTLEVPPDPAAAVDALFDGDVVDVDLGRVDGQVFLNVASFGLSVGVTEALSDQLKKRLGPVAYPLATLRAYRRHRPFSARLEFPDGDHEPIELHDLLQVAVGNGRHYGGGNTVAPNASVDDALLDVFAIEAGRLRDHVSIARLLKSGSFVEHENVHHLTTRRVWVDTEAAMPVNLDGEVSGSTPATFSLEPNALHVVVPHGSRAASLDGSAPSTTKPTPRDS